MNRDELVLLLKQTMQAHTPAEQERTDKDNSSPGRCMLCNYTRYPCEVAEICELVLEHFDCLS